MEATEQLQLLRVVEVVDGERADDRVPGLLARQRVGEVGLDVAHPLAEGRARLLEHPGGAVVQGQLGVRVGGEDVAGEEAGAGAEVEHAADVPPGQAERLDGGPVEGVVVGHDAAADGLVLGRDSVKLGDRSSAHGVQDNRQTSVMSDRLGEEGRWVICPPWPRRRHPRSPASPFARAPSSACAKSPPPASRWSCSTTTSTSRPSTSSIPSTPTRRHSRRCRG